MAKKLFNPLVELHNSAGHVARSGVCTALVAHAYDWNAPIDEEGAPCGASGLGRLGQLGRAEYEDLLVRALARRAVVVLAHGEEGAAHTVWCGPVRGWNLLARGRLRLVHQVLEHALDGTLFFGPHSETGEGMVDKNCDQWHANVGDLRDGTEFDPDVFELERCVRWLKQCPGGAPA